MGKDLGLTSTMFGPGHHPVLRDVRDLRHSQQHHAQYRRRPPLDRHFDGGLGIASTATMFATGPNSLYVLRMLVELPKPASSRTVAVLNFLVPGAIPRPRQRPVYDCDARHHGAWLAGFRVYS